MHARLSWCNIRYHVLVAQVLSMMLLLQVVQAVHAVVYKGSRMLFKAPVAGCPYCSDLFSIRC